jgi:hypothetical protein
MEAMTSLTIAVLLLALLGALVLLVLFRRRIALPRHKAGDTTEPYDYGTTSEDILQAIEQLLAAPPERMGFVIFRGHADRDYVQYALEVNGLLLNWPAVDEPSQRRLDMFVEELTRRGFVELPPAPSLPPAADTGNPYQAPKSQVIDDEAYRQQIAALAPSQFVILDDGLYAQAGRDAPRLRDLTLELLRDIFGVQSVAHVGIVLQPNG